MSLPQFSREPTRPRLDEEIAKELWQPDWRCFCCHDTGLVARSLVLMVISDYDHMNDKPVACQHPRCEKGWEYRGTESCDQRFEMGVCVQLDKFERENWRRTIREQFDGWKQAQAKISALTVNIGMPGARGRSANDEREIEIRKGEVENIAQEDWQKMTEEYSGSGA